MILKNKIGSHVGMILSFVIFITFVVFVYVTMSPNIETSGSKRTLLNEISLVLIENMSSNFTSMSVSINSTTNPSTNCISLEGILIYSEISPNVIVKDISQQKQLVYYDPKNDGSNIRINRSSLDQLFCKIYSSPEFDKIPQTSTSSCTTLPFGVGYKIGSWNSGKYIFEKNILPLVEQYNQDYAGLKNSLHISPGNEFGFEFVLNDGTRIPAFSNLPKQIFTLKKFLFSIFDGDANILSGFINIKIW